MNKEVFLVGVFDIIIRKILIPALMFTVMAGVINSLVVLVINRSQKGQKMADRKSISPQTGIVIAQYNIRELLKWLFHEWIRIVIILVLLAAILYSLIFAYSLYMWKGMLPEQEFEQALTDRLEYNDNPLSRPTNLISVRKEEIECAFGDAVRDDLIKEYNGMREDRREYCIRVLYLPVIERVFWYEIRIYIG